MMNKLILMTILLSLMISFTVSVKFHRYATSHKTQKHRLTYHAHKMNKSQLSSVFSKIAVEPRFMQSDAVKRQNKRLSGLSKFRFKESIREYNPDFDGDIKFRGWLKFLIFDGKGQPALKFYKNPAFKEQSKKTFDQEAEDLYGSVEIPNEVQFFFLVGSQGVFALTSRRNDMIRTAKSLLISEIKPIFKSVKGFSGGLEDLGNFKEGFCFKVITMNQEWVMCAESLPEKENFMQALLDIKGSQTVFNEAEKKLEGTATLSSTDFSTAPIPYQQTGPDGEAITTEIGGSPIQTTSQWKDLQDWSTCTLACGGGTQTLQRVCILGTDPASGPCAGESVLTRPCNQSPCETVPGAEVEQEQLPMKIKMERVSYRPQRYETCIIKEGDMDIVREDLGNFFRPIRVPTRVVLNNMTLTVFQNVQFDTVLFSAELGKVVLNAYPGDDGCFVASGANKGVTLCSLATIQGISPKANRDEWVKQIGFFRDNCQSKLVQENPDMDIANIKQGQVDQEVEEAKSMAHSASSPSPDDQSAQTASMAVDALSKEAKYEKLAESEELDREVLEELDARKRMEQLKASDECLERDQRKAQAALREQATLQEAKDQVGAMKENIKNMVMDQRANMSKKIIVMKKLADKQMRAKLGQMQELRLKMAKAAMASAKLGDMKLCDPKQPAADKSKYCNKEFDTDPDLNKDCKDPEQFCTICCENEIGLKYPTERNACIQQCGQSKKGGSWIWVPEANAVKTF